MENVRVLVLGAYGQAGRAVIHELLQRPNFHVVASGRNQTKLEALCDEISTPTLSYRTFDVADSLALSSALSDVDFVVNCVGPYIEFGQVMARAAIEAGVHYIDVAAEQEHYRRLERLHDHAKSKGVMVATGFGLFPGMSGLLLLHMWKRLPNATRVRMSLFQGSTMSADAGAASLIGAVVEMCFDMNVLRNGQLEPVVPCERIRVRMPEPFGEVDTMLWPNSEILSLSKRMTLESICTTLKIGVGEIPSKRVVHLIRWLKPHRRRFVFRILSNFMRKRNVKLFALAREMEMDPRAVVSIELESDLEVCMGEIVATAENATAILPALAIDHACVTVLPGLVTPDQMFNPERFFDDIAPQHSSIRWRIDD